MQVIVDGFLLLNKQVWDSKQNLTGMGFSAGEHDHVGIIKQLNLEPYEDTDFVSIEGEACGPDSSLQQPAHLKEEQTISEASKPAAGLEEADKEVANGVTPETINQGTSTPTDEVSPGNKSNSTSDLPPSVSEKECREDTAADRNPELPNSVSNGVSDSCSGGKAAHGAKEEIMPKTGEQVPGMEWLLSA